MKRSFSTSLFFRFCGKEALVAIEALLDISSALIAQEGFRHPGSYSEIIMILEENGILSPQLAKKLEPMPKFRNLLVHDYADIDLKRIYEIVSKNLNDLVAFKDSLILFLKI